MFVVEFGSNLDLERVLSGHHGWSVDMLFCYRSMMRSLVRQTRLDEPDEGL
jgi:hypothetical protein